MDWGTLQVIREDEGKSLTVYKDHLGNLTVGVGHLVVDDDFLEFGDEITEAQSMNFFFADAKTAEQGMHTLAIAHKIKCTHTVARVLTCMVFQMGLTGVGKFKRFLKALAREDYPLAYQEMLDSKWAKEDTPARAERLAKSLWTPSHGA